MTEKIATAIADEIGKTNPLAGAIMRAALGLRPPSPGDLDDNAPGHAHVATLRRELAAMVRERDAALARVEALERKIEAFTNANTLDGIPNSRARIVPVLETFAAQATEPLHVEIASLRQALVDKDREWATAIRNAHDANAYRDALIDRLTRIERAVLRADPRAEVGDKLDAVIEDMLSDRCAATARVVKTWLDEIDSGPEKAIARAKDDRTAHVKLVGIAVEQALIDESDAHDLWNPSDVVDMINRKLQAVDAIDQRLSGVLGIIRRAGLEPEHLETHLQIAAANRKTIADIVGVVKPSKTGLDGLMEAIRALVGKDAYGERRDAADQLMAWTPIVAAAIERVRVVRTEDTKTVRGNGLLADANNRIANAVDAMPPDLAPQPKETTP